MSRAFKAVSDAAPRRALELLRDEPRSAGEPYEHFAVSTPSMSRHCALLREGRLIAADRQGKSIFYHLQMSVLEEALFGFAGAFGWRLEGGKRKTTKREGYKT